MVSNLRECLWNERNYLLVITLIALCVRSIWFICYTQYENYEIAIDSKQYQEIAVQISQNKGITTKNNQPNFFRLPGYPIILAGLYKLFGSNPLASMVVQVIAATVIPMLIFLCALAVLPGNLLGAKIAGFMAALHPGFIYFAGVQATETTFLIFFLLFLIFFFKAINSGQRGYFCIAGLFLGIASLIRALGHYVILLSVVLIFLLINQTLSKRLTNATVLFASWFLIVGVWLIRNYMLTGFIFLHTLTGQHFLRYNVVYNLMETEKVTYSQAKQKIFSLRDDLVASQELSIGRRLSEAEINIVTEKLAFQEMRRQPFLTIKYACIEIYKICVARYSSLVLNVPPGIIFGPNTALSYKINMYLQTFKTYPIIIPFVIWDWLFSLVLNVGIGLCVFYSYRTQDNMKIMLAIFSFIVLLVALTSSIGLIRLRIPAEPFLIILASYGWAYILETNYRLKAFVTAW